MQRFKALMTSSAGYRQPFPHPASVLQPNLHPQMSKPTWPEVDVQSLWLDLSDVLCCHGCLVAQGPVFHHLQFAGGRLHG